MSGFDPLIDIKSIERLADNPREMATRILQLEKKAREWKIGSDPSRKAALLERLNIAAEDSKEDAEAAHSEADDALLEYINDEGISNAYGKVKRWFG